MSGERLTGSVQQNPICRRSLLRGFGVTAGIALAGCSQGSSNGTQPPSDENDVIQDTSFEGMDLVVGLREGHDVSRLNLISPDGTLFAQTDVAKGTTTARLQILEIAPGGQSKHYTPGTHELVAIIGEETVSMSLDLRPDLRITDIRQYREGEPSGEYANITVTIENRGTAPTWIYSIVTEGAPNFAANNELTDDPGAVFLSHPDSQSDLILYADASQSYTDNSYPILFTDDQKQNCSGTESDFVVIAGVANGPPLRQKIRFRANGDVISAGSLGEYTCKNIDINIIDGDSG